MNLPTGLSDYTVCTQEYAGWGASINRLIADISSIDHQADWFVGGGDDTDPVPIKTADQITNQLSACFLNLHGKINPRPEHGRCFIRRFRKHSVSMQPTGDRWGENELAQARLDAPAYIDRICGAHCGSAGKVWCGA